MAELFLNDGELYSLHHQLESEGMPEPVRMHPLGNASVSAGRRQELTDVARPKHPTRKRAEQRRVSGKRDIGSLLLPSLDELYGASVDPDRSFALALAK